MPAIGRRYFSVHPLWWETGTISRQGEGRASARHPGHDPHAFDSELTVAHGTPMPAIERDVPTKDGRVPRMLEDGDPREKPVFYLRGTPGSRLLQEA